MSAESFGAKKAGDPETRERDIATAIARFLDAQAYGDPVDLDSFCRDNADLLPELRLELEAVRRIDAALDSSHGESSAAGAKEPMPERLSGLRVLAELGAGGMGRVFLALDDRLNRKVAIKMLDARYWPDHRLADRFMREARAMAQLSHPNIAAIYNLGAAGEPPHFVMEYSHGVPLTAAAQPLRLPQRMELFRKVVMAVEFLHQHSIVHRDLKPGNVLVGSDLEPKVLDFGLALQRNVSERQLTRSGEVLGTLDYFSPEQAHAGQDLDARSDVFSLGVILYELLTGRLPFRGENQRAQIRALYDEDPVLPRRIEPNLPGDLQNICLKALEKHPKNRYSSAREMADDLQRFLAGEPILAVPAAYSRMMAGKVEQHLRELAGWTQDHLLTNLEFDSFRRMYDRLAEHEDAWIMQVRRLSFSQVTLYFGAWILVVGAALILLFLYRSFGGPTRVLVNAAAAMAMLLIGVRCWQKGQRRIGVAYLLAFCLLMPVLLILVMRMFHWMAWATQNQSRLEFFRVRQDVNWQSPQQTVTLFWATNAQMWWSILLSIPWYVWLRRFTRSTVFSLVSAFMGALLCLVTLLRMGLLDWIGDYPGRFYLRLLPFAAMFFLLAIGIERLRHGADARYFYFFAVAFTLVGLSGVAAVHEPYANWLKSVVSWSRGQIEYLFIINAAIYFVLQHVCDRFPSAEMRWVAKTFRFVIPGHVLTSILALGIDAAARWHDAEQDVALRHEARLFEILLPLAACAFVFGSIPKQMKNYLATGLLFLALGIIRLQQDLFSGHAAWPVVLLFAGLLLMIAAANYSSLKTALRRLVHRNL